MTSSELKQLYPEVYNTFWGDTGKQSMTNSGSTPESSTKPHQSPHDGFSRREGESGHDFFIRVGKSLKKPQ